MNSDLMVIAAYLANWTQRHDVPLRDVTVNLHARTVEARTALESAVLRDNVFNASAVGANVRDFILHGVRIRIT